VTWREGGAEKVCERDWRLFLPTRPEWSREVSQLAEGEALGVSLNGVPIFPPMASGRNMLLPSSPQAADQVECDGSAEPTTGAWRYRHPQIGCKRDVTSRDLIGFALDGFPIYGAFRELSAGEVDKLLDRCNGRWGKDGTYRYHVRAMHQVDHSETDNARLRYVLGCFHGAEVATLETGTMFETCQPASRGVAPEPHRARRVVRVLEHDAPGGAPSAPAPRGGAVRRAMERLRRAASFGGEPSRPAAAAGDRPPREDMLGGFPADARMETADGRGRVRMDALRIGDRVAVSGPAGGAARRAGDGEIFFFSQASASPPGESYLYLTLRLASGHNVTLAPAQFLPLNGALAAAHTAAVGDAVTLSNSRTSSLTGILPTRRRTRYSPHVTGAGGMLVVNDVVVSAGSVGAAPGAVALAPVEALYRACSMWVCRRMLEAGAVRTAWSAMAALAPRGSDYPVTS
jgi:hypothetical protein